VDRAPVSNAKFAVFVAGGELPRERLRPVRCDGQCLGVDRGTVERVARVAGGSVLRTCVAGLGVRSTSGVEGRIAPVLAGVLASLPTGRTFARVRGFLDHAHRFSLYPAPSGRWITVASQSACPPVQAAS